MAGMMLTTSSSAGFGAPNRRKRVFLVASLHGDARDVLLSQVREVTVFNFKISSMHGLYRMLYSGKVRHLPVPAYLILPASYTASFSGFHMLS